jgi:hypothetical protein
MEIDQIRYFLAIYDKRNFTRAAQTPRRQRPPQGHASRGFHSLGDYLQPEIMRHRDNGRNEQDGMRNADGGMRRLPG